MIAGRLSALCLALVAGSARGADLEEAKPLFRAGAAAFQQADYRAAIQAFEQAYAKAAIPAIAFSLAQSHRRQFAIDQRPEDLARAIALFEKYVAEMPPGKGRRGDAALALAELRARAGAVASAEGALATSAPPAGETRILVTSSAKGARGSLDGAPAEPLPLIKTVPEGRHKVVVTAPGYFEETAEVDAVKGILVPRDVPLREQPARLVVRAEEGATISIDAQLVGEAPLPAAVELDAGRHFVTASLPGRIAFQEEIELGRGERRALEVALPVTGQRIASFVTLGAAGGAVLVGGVATAVALAHEADARDIEEARAGGNIFPDDVLAHNDAIDARDGWRTVALAAFGAGAAIGVAGLLLYALDHDEPEVRLFRFEEKRETGPGDETPTEVTLAPLGPAEIGIAARIRL
jgi:hypothetical protein